MRTVRITNEFADVIVSVVTTGKGERLQISAPRRGSQVLLDAIELEALTWQPPATFSRMLEASTGPS